DGRLYPCTGQRRVDQVKPPVTIGSPGQYGGSPARAARDRNGLLVFGKPVGGCYACDTRWIRVGFAQVEVFGSWWGKRRHTQWIPMHTHHTSAGPVKRPDAGGWV